MFHHSDPVERSPRIFKEITDAHPEKLAQTNNSIELFSICGPLNSDDENFQNCIEAMRENAPRIACNLKRYGFLIKFSSSLLMEHGYSKEQTAKILNTYRIKHSKYLSQVPAVNIQTFLQQEKDLREQRYAQLEKDDLIDTLSLCAPTSWDELDYMVVLNNTDFELDNNTKSISDIYTIIGEQMHERGYSPKDVTFICSTFDIMLEKNHPKLSEKLASLNPRRPIEAVELDVEVGQQIATQKGLFGCCCKPAVTNVHRK